MKKKLEYMLLIFADAREMEDAVNAAAADSYEPLGGVGVAMVEADQGGYTEQRTVFAQAMIRHVRPPRPEVRMCPNCPHPAHADSCRAGHPYCGCTYV